jgi:DNA-binding NarL/FixJ family response regulator
MSLRNFTCCPRCGYEEERAEAPPADDDGFFGVQRLSSAEEKTVTLLMQGCQASAIAKVLGVSISSAKQRLTRCYRKLGVTTGLELIAKAHREGGLALWCYEPIRKNGKVVEDATDRSF